MLPAQEPTATALPNHVLVNARLVDQVFVNIYERVNPSVVNIEVVSQTSLSNSFNASGSGFVYDLDGHIVTNAHVVRDAREIIVTFSDGHVADARLVGMDDFSDLAVIRVDGERERLVPVTIGDSGQLKVGQHIVAIGNPFGLQSSMTVGYVSATGRALPSEELVNLQRNSTGRFNNPSIIQVDASINPGNSGGPVLNLDGEVVGVATAIRTETGIFQGVAFAVPSNTLKRIVPQLIADGRVRYPYIGISSPDSSNGVTVAAMAETFNFAVDSGVLVSEVLEDSPADDAGIRGGNRTETFRGQPVRLGGDIIVAVDGLFVSDLDELLAYLVDNIAPNDTVILTVVRGNETLEIPVVVGERPR
jgi:2-alkenal reductase